MILFYERSWNNDRNKFRLKGHRNSCPPRYDAVLTGEHRQSTSRA